MVNSEQLQSCLSNEEPSIVVKQTFIPVYVVRRLFHSVPRLQ